MKKDLEIAQIGFGYWGPNLVRNFLKNKEVKRFVVCDADKKMLEKAAAKYPSVETTETLDVILSDPRIDAVVVALPAALHYKYAKTVLLANKHVMVEKPIAMKTDEAKELIHLAEEKEKILMVGHTFLYNEAVRKAKEYIDSGELGDIYYILSQRLNLGRVRYDVNAMWNLAPHDISIILYWLNEFPSGIDARGYCYLQDGIEDLVFMNLVFPSGRAAHIHVSWLDPGKVRKMTIVGSKKMLIYNDVSSDMKLIIHDKGIDKSNIIRELPQIENFGRFHFLHRTGDIHIPKIDFQEPLSVECRHFIDSIMAGKNVLTDGRNGQDVVEILETAQKALDRSGR